MTKKQLNIAYIGQKGIPVKWGGVERVTEEIAVRMARAGYNVTAYCRAWYTGGRAKTYKGVALIYTPSINTKHLDTVSHTLFSTIHALWRGFDVIHFQGIGPALFAWLPRIFSPRTRVLVTFHCLDRRLQKWNVLARLVFWLGELAAMKCAHDIFVTSRFLQDYCYEVWGRTAVYLPNGVFDDVNELDAIYLEQFGLRAFEYAVIVGRLMKDKAQHEAIEAFLRVKKNNSALADMKLVVIGDATETDSYRAALREQAANHADIVFVGTQIGAPLKALMRFARAGISPSYSEGMPLAVLELAAFNVPLVISDISAHREIFGDGYPLVPVGDIDRLAYQLETVLTHYDAVLPVARIFAARVKEHYHWEIIAARYNVTLIAGRPHSELFALAAA